MNISVVDPPNNHVCQAVLPEPCHTIAYEIRIRALKLRFGSGCVGRPQCDIGGKGGAGLAQFLWRMSGQAEDEGFQLQLAGIVNGDIV